MPLEYRLTLAGDTPLAQVAAQAFPDPAERPTPYEDILITDLSDSYGFNVVIISDDHAFYSAATEDGRWQWEPSTCVDVTFQIDKFGEHRDTAVRALLRVVARLLASGNEDAALMVNGDTLLLTRTDGQIRKYQRATWWQHDSELATIIPDPTDTPTG